MNTPFTDETLMEQAPMTVAGYLRAAIREIDSQFGDGYAASNPALVGAFVQACADDYAATTAVAGRQIIASDIAEVADQLGQVAAAICDTAKRGRP